MHTINHMFLDTYTGHKRMMGPLYKVVIGGCELPNMGAGNESERLTTETSLQTS